MKIFKKFGRFFLTLTEEEKYIEPQTIQSILFIHMEGERHYEEALNNIKNRFRFAELKEIKGNRRALLKEMKHLRDRHFSAVIILNLDPFIILCVYWFFNSYLLLYNKFGQWFLIRKKTFYEFLVGRKGWDKQHLDWKIAKGRFLWAKCIVDLALISFIFIKNSLKVIKLFLYLIYNLPLIYIKRALYNLIKK